MTLQRRFNIGLIFILLLGFSFSSFAQEPAEVKKSSNKVVIEGRIYYIHVVKPGQTLYSISKAYGVSDKDIAVENPGAYSSLQVGQVLKIPENPLGSPRDKKEDSVRYLRHEVLPKENIYALSRKYNVSVQEIKDANPDINYEQLDIGQVILIPRTKVTYREEDFIRHKVRRKETLYGLSKRYNISEEDIKEYNPELQWGELKTGQILRIPRPEMLEEEDETTATDEQFEFEDLLEMGTKDTIPAMDLTDYRDSLVDLSGRRIKIAYLIPFNYKELMFRDSLRAAQQEDGGEAEEQQEDTDPKAVRFLEFFEGSLIAVDSLKKSGLSLDIHYFDTEKRPDRTREILQSDFFRDVDLIIGPFYSYNVEIVSEFSRKYRIPVISPFYAETSLTRSNPYLFQMNPSDQTEFAIASEYLAKDYDRNFVFIHSNDSLLNSDVDMFKTSLMSSLSKYTFPDNVVIKEIMYDNAAKADLTSDLNLTLSKDRKNIVIIPDTDEVFVSTVLSQLYFQLRNFDIEVFGRPDFSAFRNAEYKYYHALQLRYLTPYYFTYEEKRIENFLETYLRSIHAEPQATSKEGCYFAFLGYDLSFYFLEKIARYSNDFVPHLNEPGTDNLMVNFHFRRPSFSGGFENEAMELIRYNKDFSIKSEQALLLPEIEEKEEPEKEKGLFHFENIF